MLKNLSRAPTNTGNTWLPALVTTVVWAALGLSALAWGLATWPKDDKPLADSVAAPQAASAAVVQAADIAKVLGAASSDATPVDSSATVSVRLSLLGVALAAQGKAIALISLDGQAPKPFHVGATVSPGLVLQAVTPTQALLGTALKSPTLSTLDLPKRP